MTWRAEDPQGNESAKCKYDIVRYTRGIGFDVGCGPSKAFPHFIGVDNKKDTELFGIEMRPDLVVEDACRLSEHAKPESADFIFSSHMLEHVEDHIATLKDWWSCIKPGGHLILYLPHKDLYPNIGQPGANPDHKHDFLPADIVEAMRGVGNWSLLVNEDRADGMEYSFLQVYRKGGDTQSYDYLLPKPAKSACVVRHGGIGDQMQAAYLFPELKRQGYHITMLTTPKGREPLEHDPHIDDWFMVDKDQVPPPELARFWKAIRKHYDKFVNLNESVEGTLLAMEGRANHAWAHTLRHRMLNHNYAEFAADLAELPFVPEGKFYQHYEEDIWASRQIAEWTKMMGGSEHQVMGVNLPKPFLIMYALSGSSPHKFSPHQDLVIRMILGTLRRAVVILVGDKMCKILEQGWELERRVIKLSGELTVRQTLALAQHMDVVLGPETGVMNAVCYQQDIAKVVLLSHSSPENLTKHWANTTAIPGVAPCYPCHQLHHTMEYCREDKESGAAICQKNVDPRAIMAPILFTYEGWAKVQVLRLSA